MAELNVGEMFEGRYQITGVLGRGGFGTVYQAHDSAAGRDVAIKLLPSDEADSSTRARFQREIRVLASLRSPHTLTLHDCGESAIGLYLVSELLPGEDLAELLEREDRLPPTAVVHILRQLLASLREAHEAGLLHRDIKPENVRVFRQGDDPYYVKLLDFGLAKEADSEEPSVTAAGELVGTPRYMSPEQITEKSLSPSSDLYSLGMVALEMLLGRDALQGNRWSDQLDRLRSGHQFSIPEIERVGTGVTAIIGRMTARDPQARYHSASAVLTALDGLDQAPPPTLPALVPEHPRPDSSAPVSRGVELMAIIGGIIVLAGVLVLVVVALSDRSPPEPDPSFRQRPTPGVVRSPESSSPDRDMPGDVGGPTEFGEYASSGCGGSPRSQGLDRVIDHQSGGRFLVHIPAGYDPAEPIPILVLLHPVGYTGERFLEITGFAALADEHDFVVVVPGIPFDLADWSNVETTRESVIRSLEVVSAKVCLDWRRVYVVGQAEGGGTSTVLTCEPWVTAVVSSTYRPSEGWQMCDAPRPFLMLAPTRSKHEPFEGGTSCSGRAVVPAAEVEKRWRQRNRCAPTDPVVEEIRDGRCYTWDCETPFRSCHLEGGHNWPGSEPRIADLLGCDGEPPDFPSATVAWEFFAATEPLALEHIFTRVPVP